MAYQTGVPASTTALIDTYINWIVAQCGFSLGNTWTFTADSGAANGSGSTNWTGRALLRDSQYIYLAWPTTNPDRLTLNTGTVNPTTGRLNAQTGCYTASNMLILLGTAPSRYWMFANGYSAHCVAEWKGGAYQHIHAGYVEKYGSWVGGVYASGIYNDSNSQYGSGNLYSILNGYHYSPFGYPQVFTIRGSLQITYGGGTVKTFSFVAGDIGSGLLHSFGIIYGSQPNTYNGRAVLTPIELSYSENLSGYQLRPIGRISNCALINIANINPGDTILTDWMAFPWSAKNSGGTTAEGYVNSENYGIAYKK
jgi:hypothetical protein